MTLPGAARGTSATMPNPLPKASRHSPPYTCGFGKYSIDIRLTLAETYLAAGSTRKALQNARKSLDRSEHPDCRYAWGQANGFHLCVLAHLRLGERVLARERLTAALEIRQRLGHGCIEETRRALEDLHK